MNNELLPQILDKLNIVNTHLEIIGNAFLWFIGVIVAIIVIYILYKCVDIFISF